MHYVLPKKWKNPVQRGFFTLKNSSRFDLWFKSISLNIAQCKLRFHPEYRQSSWTCTIWAWKCQNHTCSGTLTVNAAMQMFPHTNFMGAADNISLMKGFGLFLPYEKVILIYLQWVDSNCAADFVNPNQGSFYWWITFIRWKKSVQ